MELIVQKNGFTIFNDVNQNTVPIGRSLAIQSSKIEECIEFMRVEGIKNVIISKSHGYYLNNVDFLIKNSFITGVQIVDKKINIAAINKLYNLENLLLSYSYNEIIDFSNFPKLKFCTIVYSDKVVNLNLCKNLKLLHLYNYSYTSLDAVILALRSLEYFKLSHSAINTLEGVDFIENLVDLELYDLRNLDSINEIKRHSKTMKRLYIYKCLSLHNFTPIEELVNLEYLNILNSGDSDSIMFVRNLKKLVVGGININIIDGDMSPCVGINIAFKDFKHFSLKNKELQKLNSAALV